MRNMTGSPYTRDEVSMTNFSANINKLYVWGNNSRILTNFIMGMNERNNYDAVVVKYYGFIPIMTGKWFTINRFHKVIISVTCRITFVTL